MSATGRIAVIGMACRYPDADSPDELWENALSQRRAFRRIPDERTRLADYHSPDPTVPDRFYAPNAAVIEGYEFDRLRFRVAGSTYRSTDLTHWLALDMAAAALSDAGFPGGDGLPRVSTAVIVGNTLAGEFSRANLLRLRWPYVRRAVAATLGDHGWDGERLAGYLDTLEAAYRAPFPPVDEDTLAGGLANTIAGRICNHFDLGGGGYTVDGACSSSLLSVAHACRALTGHDADIAVAGGVDLSLDPFELVGFAKTGALAREEMRVYDRRSSGFWPGEGCGMLVLAREEDARARGDRVYALIRGWGVSSDGRGGITRPEVAGQRLALERAYARAGFGADTVGYFEGHGTGTAVGDPTEIRAISAVRGAADPSAPRAALGTVKANIGHTKAAAGVAGLLKAVMAVHHRAIPPTTGCRDPHPALDDAAVRVTFRPEPWPADRPARAGVSSMGFGGINTHIVLEQPDTAPTSSRLPERAATLGRSAQDAELLLFDAATPDELRGRLAAAAALFPRLSYAELADLAARLQADLADRPLRAAVVAASPEQAHQRVTRLDGLVAAGARDAVDADSGVFLGRAGRAPRIVFAFPGQGSGRGGDCAVLRRRLTDVDRFYAALNLPGGDDPVATASAQPRIAAASAAAALALERLGVTAATALGHSLGELTALHWAGVMGGAALVRIAAERGRIMTDTSDGDGAMASVAATPEETAALLADGPAVVAGLNAPRQTVVSGPAAAVADVVAAAGRAGLRATRIPVSHAFHSPQVAPAAGAFAAHLAGQDMAAPRRPVVSTVTGARLAPDTDLRELLARQITAPVRFAEALAAASADADLIVEVGPGRVLSGLVADTVPVPVVATDSEGRSLDGLLRAVAAAFALGAPVRHAALFDGRHVKPLPEKPRFLANPCETRFGDEPEPDPAARRQANGATAPQAAPPDAGDRLELVRSLVAERAELPVDAVDLDSALLDELHLSSITVGQLVNDAVRALDTPAPTTPLNFATATVRQIAEALDELAAGAGASDEPPHAVAGVAPWVRAFALVDEPAPAPALVPGPDQEHGGQGGAWRLFAPEGHPFAERLRHALQSADAGGGVLACLPPPEEDDGATPAVALAAAQAALELDPPGRFVLVHHGDGGAAALARSLFLEAPTVPTRVVEVPPGTDPIRWVLAEATTAATGFDEARYDHAGTRTRPVLRPLPAHAEPATAPLGRDDVLLVTGGGKGITAECALDIAASGGARVALLGRSDPRTDTELAANLDRFAAAGVTVRYLRADVTDAARVKAAVTEARAALGPITAVLHGAGRNVPRRLADLDEAELRATLAPKVAGLRAVLDAVDPAELRLLVTFGSVIGRAGLAGEAHYAMANAALTDATLAYGRRHPRCRCLALEWSVWSGVGMGERLGAVESLRRGGVTPISTDDGLAMLRALLATPDTPPVLVVTGRTAGLPTLATEERETPLLRFTDRVLVHQPGVELVAQAELSTATDPYLADHELDGDRLFPAVLGLEAMAQVAAALTGCEEPPAFEEVRFDRPVVVPADAATTIRVAALARDTGAVEVVVRSEETGFQVDHFRATCRFPRPESPCGDTAEPPPTLPRVSLDPATELYGGPLFQGGRFRRLLGYRRLGLTGCVAEVGTAEEGPWFGAFLPDRLLLADPGARDAFMQAIQVSRPDLTLLPVRVERVVPATGGTAPAGPLLVDARERYREDDAIVWDVTVRDTAGDVVEYWLGLRLRVVRARGAPAPWPAALVGPYLERHLAGMLNGSAPRVAVEPHDGDPAERSAHTATALGRVLGRAVTVRHRPDGRPEVSGDTAVSVAHGPDLTLAVAGAGATCDVERVVERPDDDWRGLLGPDRDALARLLAHEHDEDIAVAATRVWCAAECARKAGRDAPEPLTVTEYHARGWTVFTTGQATVATYAAAPRREPGLVVYAVRVEED